MARFHGVIGFSDTVETVPGRYEENITEKTYFGTVLRPGRELEAGVSINDDISVSHTISVVGDAYAREHIFAMRYIRWEGVRWKIVNIQVERPRLLLRLGGVFHGPEASGTSDCP